MTLPDTASTWLTIWPGIKFRLKDNGVNAWKILMKNSRAAIEKWFYSYPLVLTNNVEYVCVYKHSRPSSFVKGVLQFHDDGSYYGSFFTHYASHSRGFSFWKHHFCTIFLFCGFISHNVSLFSPYIAYISLSFNSLN